jgi:hypothetical protein
MDMSVVIPSKGRMGAQYTIGNLPEDWCERVHLVVDESDACEVPQYDLRGATVHVHPPDIDTIAKKRQWIVENHARFGSPKIVMLDDDLKFSVRRPGGDYTSLFKPTDEELSVAFYTLELYLDTYVHAGWSMRQGNNQCEDDTVENARMCFALGYRCDWIMQMVENGFVEMNRVSVREDMDMTLQLLRAGRPNHVDFTVAVDQVKGFAAPGGCTDERTLEVSDAEALRLAELHPGLVRVVDKEYEGSPMRKEVVVSWKKAFKQARV